MKTFVTADLYNLCHEYFEYREGALYWKKKAARWTRLGGLAGSAHSEGYREIGFKRRRWLAHRLIYLMHHKELPALVDHIDQNRSNDRIENLRAADKVVNAHNSKIQVNNTSGFKGVSWDKKKNSWVVRARHNGKYVFLGNYASAEEASTVYQAFVHKGGSV